MSAHDETLGRLSEELAAALAAGEDVDVGAWAARFEVDEADVDACRRALAAFDLCLGEEDDDGRPELPRPALPEDYQIEGEIGRGGMGVVYRAVQRGLGRAVAVKVLRPGDLAFGDGVRRFRAEARSLARLRHRHIVSIHDVGETAEGLVWYAMDLVEGQTLADEIRERGRLTPSRALKIMRQVTSAIAHAHAQGIVHRDLKPQNVLIDAGGDAFVVDFGLARDAAAAGPRTMTGELLGTPAYMSPEQAKGDSGQIGEATDIWALGALLYECLTGAGPFAGKPLHETIRAILHDEPVPPRKVDARVPAALDAVCLEALHKRPAQRYATALALGEDLERFSAGRAVLARAPGRIERAARVVARHRRPLSAAAAAAALAIVGFVVLALPGLRRDAALGEATRALEGGYPGAAVESLRSLRTDGAREDPARADVDLDLVFARALNDRAGELLAAGGQENAARELAWEARQLGELRQLAWDPRVPFFVDGELRAAWRWEFSRAFAMTHDGYAWQMSGPWIVGIDPARVADALSSAHAGRREAARRTIRAFASDPGLSSLDEPQRVDALVEIHRGSGARATELDPRPPIELEPPFRWDPEQLAAWWSPSAEDALADLATDATESTMVRALALRSWSTFVGLPICDTFRDARVGVGSDPATRAAAAPALVDAWRSWRNLPRDAALRARLDLLISAFETDSFGLGDRRASRIEKSVRTWTGNARARTGREAQVAWWRDSGARDLPMESWIRSALGLAAENEVTFEQALNEAVAAEDGTVILWRHLAWLQLPDGVRVPEAVPVDARESWPWIDAWWGATARDDRRVYIARIAVLAFPDAQTAPILVGEHAARVAIGRTVRLTVDGYGRLPLRSTASVGARGIGDDERRAFGFEDASGRSAEPGDVHAELNGFMTTGAGGPVLRWQQRADLQTNPPTSSVSLHGHAGGGPHDVLVGRARAAELEYLRGDRGGATFELLLLVRVDPVDDAPADASLEAWRAAVVRSLQDGAVSGSPGNANRADGLLAWFWPLPEARAALERLEGEFSYPHPAAALLAGAAPAPDTGLDGLPSYLLPGTVLARIATTSPNADAREWAVDQLRADPQIELSPGTADVLLAADTVGDVDLDEPLRRRIEAISAARPHEWLRVDVLLAALLGLAALTGAALAFARAPIGPDAAWVGWTAANALVFVRLDFDGWVVFPSWLALGLAALAALGTSARPETRVIRRFVGAVYGAGATWLLLSTARLVPPPGWLMVNSVWTAAIVASWALLLRAGWGGRSTPRAPRGARRRGRLPA